MRPLDHAQRDKIDSKPVSALLAMGFDVDPMQAHVSYSAKSGWENRFVFTATHFALRTESERVEKVEAWLNSLSS